MSRTKLPLVLAAVGIVAALTGALLARGVLHEPSSRALKSGMLLEPPRPTADFALIDQDGAPFNRQRLADRWTLMFFGFTSCGDVCPTTLTVLANVAKLLTTLPAPQQPQVVFVSVDAKRDPPEIIKPYLKHFDATFIGVTGAQADLNAFTQSLGVPSAIRPLDNGNYAVDHSASILAFNPRGELRALFSPPHTADALASDYRLLVATQP